MVSEYRLSEATNTSSMKVAGRNDIEVNELIDYIYV